MLFLPRTPDTWENISFDDVNYLAGMAYTGQEYLEHTQLYHYNGRLGVYPDFFGNPISCRMLSPDKIVANPRNGQNGIYPDFFGNRYSYVLNNPLKYTDPSGWQVYQPQKPSDVVGSNFTNWDLSGFGLYQDPSGIIQDYATALQTSRGGSSFGTTISNARVTFTNPNYDNDFGSELLSLVKNFSQYLEYKYNVSGSTSGEPGLTQVGDKQFEFNKEVNIVAERKIAESAQSGETWSDNVDWGGVADASLGIIGGVFEVAVGVAGEVFTGGLSTALVLDGVYRIGTNAFRLGAYLTDNAKVGNALPNNLGSTVGKFIDAANGSGFYDVGVGQSTLGLTNDLLLIASPGGNAGAIRSVITNPTIINSVGLGASYYSGTIGLFNNGRAFGAAYGR